MNRDWLLPSDRQLIHWLYFLEGNPEVASFDLAPEPVLSEDKDEVRATELDAIVYKRDGLLEWHEVKTGGKPPSSASSQLEAQARAAQPHNAKYIIYTDTQLQPVSTIALRWLKPLAYAEVIRDTEYTAERMLLASYIHHNTSGTIGDLLAAGRGHDVAVLLGLVVRLCASGIILLDLTRNSFGLLTPWQRYEH